MARVARWLTDDGRNLPTASLCEAEGVRGICLGHAEILEVEEVERDGEKRPGRKLNNLEDCHKFFPPGADTEGGEAVVVIHDSVYRAIEDARGAGETQRDQGGWGGAWIRGLSTPQKSGSTVVEREGNIGQQNMAWSMGLRLAIQPLSAIAHQSIC